MTRNNRILIAALALASLFGFQSEGFSGTEGGTSPSREGAAPAGGGLNKTTDPKASRWGTDREQVKRRWDTVNTLVEVSSGAKKVSSSGRPEAVALRDQARSLRDDAKVLIDKGDMQAASDKLSQATQKMFAAIKDADGGASKRNKQEEDYKRRLESVRVLTDALDRIGREKSSSQAGESSRQVKTMVGQSQDLMAKGDQEKARTLLDKAYVTAKTGIEHLRRGDTLVRTLHFANKHEEFDYEVDRNDTHKMLIGMLLKDSDKAADPRVKEFVAKAAELRRQADELGKSGKYEEAIRVMEQSTMELVKAIRSAGIFIPG
ncbi:MAG: YfdX family protein [Magnetococcales bacterium]|nr:YfdX family protein [Magnetococcales bacterium]